MSSLIYRLARACFRHRMLVVVTWVLVLGALGGLTAAVGGRFDDEFKIPGASSQIALDQLKMTFPQAAQSSATIVVLAPAGTKVTDTAIRSVLEAEASQIEKLPWVSYVMLPYNEHILGMISDDGTAGILSVRAKDGISVSTMTEAQREQLVQRAHELQRALPAGEIHVGGELFSVSMPKVTVVELLGVGVAVIVLIVVLGSVWAAIMPIVAAGIGAAASIMLIVTAAGITPVNSTTMILALMLALAVGIDYSLFIVSRHRDQLGTGLDVEESAARATATAGSAVVFAGLTVIVALVGLAVAGLPFITIMGAFAAVAVAIEVALALTLLPAMMGFAGERLRPKPSKRVRAIGGGGPSTWWVGVVTKVPILTIVLVVATLGALSFPAKDLALALPNSGRNVPGAADRITFDLISERFGVGYNGPLVITGTIVESNDPLGIVNGVKADVEKLPGVKLVAMAVPNQNADTMLVQIIPTTGPDDPATADLVRRLRDLAPQWKDRYGVQTSVTGFTAAAIDVSARLGQALLPFGIFVVGLSLVLLTMVFRSIWVPVKAALGYLLSVGGAFGAVTLVFNQGFGKEIINLPEALPVISFLPIILMGILFGLAMDYEVFLTSRMREEWVHGNRTTPTEEGFVHSAKVVVAAALIMFAVFAFFVPVGEGVIKPIAFGLAVGVAIDAFLVRMTLGPAIMKLLHGAAWWLPQGLDAKLPVMDVEGEALAHQLAIESWPAPDAPQVVYAEGLGAVVDGTVLFEDVNLDLAPGKTLLVTGGQQSRTALLLALTGRARLTAGEMRVLRLAMPEEAGRLRRRSVYLDGTAPDAAARIAAAPELIAINDADRLDAAARAALLDRLGPAHRGPVPRIDNWSGPDAASDPGTSGEPAASGRRRRGAKPGVTTVILGAPDARSVAVLLPSQSTALGVAGPVVVPGGVR